MLTVIALTAVAAVPLFFFNEIVKALTDRDKEYKVEPITKQMKKDFFITK